MLNEFPLVSLEAAPLSTPEWLTTPPPFAGGTGSNSTYPEALALLGLKMGSNPSNKCPCGGHGESTDRNLCVYPDGVFCFSHHGRISTEQTIAAAGLTETLRGPALDQLLDKEAERFVPRDQLCSMSNQLLQERYGWEGLRLRYAVEIVVDWATAYRPGSPRFTARLDAAFSGCYPCQAREFMTQAGLVHRPSSVASAQGLSLTAHASYQFPNLVIRKPLDTRLACQLAPVLCSVSDKGQLRATADIDRFRNLEAGAVGRSSLTGADILNRPTLGVCDGWTFVGGSLPTFTNTVRFTAKAADRSLLDTFLADLQEALAFASEQDFYTLLAYLIQPMVAHLCPGGFPGYAFSGPTKSGKDFCAAALPGMFYRNDAGAAVNVARLCSSDYELQVLLARAVGQPYLLFTEVVDAKPAQLKMLDAMLTQPTLATRELYAGYGNVPNLLTVGLTAIAKDFPDETAGRLAEVKLTESRPETIARFYEKWQHKGPELLRSLFEAVNAVYARRTEWPLVKDRRPGFGMLAALLEDAFGFDCRFEIQHSVDPLLDHLCRMHESPACSGVPKGGWSRYTIRNVAKFLHQETGRSQGPEVLAQRITTALGYRSTKTHPGYGETGFPAESGRQYHLELRREKQGGPAEREFLYISECSDTDGGDPVPREPAAPAPTPTLSTAASPAESPAESPAPDCPAESEVLVMSSQGSFPVMCFEGEGGTI